MFKKKRIPGKILMGLTITFFYLPIIYMVVFSFNESKSLTSFSGFSLRWYRHMLESHDMMDALYTTFVVAILATIISTIIGTITAIGLSKSKIVREIIEQINNLPIMNPEIVTAIGFMLLFITFKIDRGYLTVLLAHIAFCIPYVILSIMPKMRSLDPDLASAAMDLGATPLQALTKVIIPQITPGIVSGALIAFTMSIDDFIISYFVTGNGVKNLSIIVYTMSKRVNPSINAVSTLVILVITIVLIIVNLVPVIMTKQRKKSALKETPGVNSAKHKRKWTAPVAVLLVISIIGVAFIGLHAKETAAPYAGKELRLYISGEYIDEEILTAFEEKTGATVMMENFDSNEQMYIKVANGEAFDILIPSDYMIERLIQEDYLQPLDQSLITCRDKLDIATLNQTYDPENKYTIPYFWGSVGIVYDKTKVSLEELEKEGYNIFLNQKYKGDVYLYDSERDSFMMALKALGYSMNTTNEKELQAAYEWLLTCVETMDTEIVMDEIIDNMAQGRKALGIAYSGDATYIIDENKNIGFFLPNEGTNIWYDSMVIPKNAKNIELAHEFMNFVNEYENAYANSDYIGYTSPNKDVMRDIYSPGGSLEGIEAYIPRKGYEKDEVFLYNENTKKIMGDLWSRVKVAASNVD